MISPIVTLTTDWGYSDFFAGAVKGRLYTDIPNVRVVDITHGIDPFSLRKAIFVVKNGCLSFPPGTIHIIDVCSSQTKEHPFVVVSYAQQYYICTDNGLPHAVFEDQYDKAVVIDGIRWDSDFYTFAARDLFCKVAAMIAADTPIEQLGLPVESFFKTTAFNPRITSDSLSLNVLYVDSYGNADLNITYADFERYRQGRSFVMRFFEYSINQVTLGYHVDPHKISPRRSYILLTVSSSGYLQLAIYEGSADQMLNLRNCGSITVTFQ